VKFMKAIGKVFIVVLSPHANSPYISLSSLGMDEVLVQGYIGALAYFQSKKFYLSSLLLFPRLGNDLLGKLIIDRMDLSQ
jgi:hypothetical protein